MKQQPLFWTLFACLMIGINHHLIAQHQKATIIEVISPANEPSLTPETPTDSDIKHLHQIYLDRPAKKLHYIGYHDGTPLKGRLSPDRMRIYIENYEKKGRITAQLTYKGSKAPEELKRSSCFIDPLPEF